MEIPKSDYKTIFLYILIKKNYRSFKFLREN